MAFEIWVLRYVTKNTDLDAATIDSTLSVGVYCLGRSRVWIDFSRRCARNLRGCPLSEG